MINNLIINQELKRLEYSVSDIIYDPKTDECNYIEKYKVYELMLDVIDNWNLNNPNLLLCKEKPAEFDLLP